MEVEEEVPIHDTEDNVVKRFTLTEYPVDKQLDRIFLHPDLREEDRPRYKSYCDEVVESECCLDVEYVMYRKYGRYFVENQHEKFTATTMWRKARSYFYADGDVDIDGVNFHSQILYNLVKGKADFKYLKNYINNRQKFIDAFDIPKELIDKYNKKNKDCLTKKDLIKNLVTRTLYGSALDKWVKDFQAESIEIPKEYYKLREDFKTASLVILHDNQFKPICKESQELWVQNAQKRWEQKVLKGKWTKKNPAPAFDKELEKIPSNKVVATILQDQERLIIDDVMKLVKEEGFITTVYAYDGIQVKKQEGIDELVKSINNNVGKKWGVEFLIKPFVKPLSDIKITLPPFFCKKFFSYCMKYETQKKYFEEHIFKILDMGHFSYIGPDERVRCISNEKFHFGSNFGWFDKYKMGETEIPEYITYDIYPIPEKCPKYVKNTWKGFEIEKEEYNDVSYTEDISIILNHFKVVANDEKGEDKVYEYLLNWFAHIVQKPDVKTGVCLLFQGLSGTGKTTLAEKVMRSILGKSYIFDTSDIEKVCGKFNSICRGAIIGVLNEAAAGDTMKNMDKIKDSITREYMMLEHKGKDPIQINDYVNFIYTSNNRNPVKVDEDDRRFQVIEVSSEKKGNIPYFRALDEALKNDKALRKSFYYFLKKRNITEFNPERDRVVTKATIELHDLNKEPIYDFIDYMFSPGYFNKAQVKYQSYELYKEFKDWWSLSGRKADRVCNDKLFGKKMKIVNNDKLTFGKTDGYTTYKFDFEKKCEVKDVEEFEEVDKDEGDDHLDIIELQGVKYFTNADFVGYVNASIYKYVSDTEFEDGSIGHFDKNGIAFLD